MKLVLADDHALVRQCVRVCLEGVANIEVVVEASSGPEALELILKHTPDAAVLDISMPGLSGIEVMRRLQEARSTCRVVTLSMHSERELVAAAFQSGAAGYVVKSAAFDDLVRALDVVASGGIYVSPSISHVIRDRWADPESTPRLAPREREVLRAIADGRHTKVIATELGVSEKTVHAIRLRLMNKLQVNSVAELTKCALRLGLTVLE